MQGTSRCAKDARGLGRVQSPLHLDELTFGLVSPFILAPLFILFFFMCLILLPDYLGGPTEALGKTDENPNDPLSVDLT